MQHRELQETHRGRNQGHVALLQNRGGNRSKERRAGLKRAAFSGEDKGGMTEEISQREGRHLATQKARHNFWKSNAPTVGQIMDKEKEGLDTHEEEEENGPNSDSQPKNPSKTNISSNTAERSGVSALQGDLW